MAKYRQIHTSIWTDPFFEDLDSEQKLFYIYLLTNNRTTQCGIYEITKKTISHELDYPMDTVCRLIEFFSSSNKIRYCDETKEIFILNWLKYNWIDSKPVRNCMYKELQQVKSKIFIDEFNTLLIPYGYRIDTLCLDKKDGIKEEKDKNTVDIPSPYPIDTVSKNENNDIDTVGIDLGEEKEEEKEKEKNNKKNNNNNVGFDFKVQYLIKRIGKERVENLSDELIEAMFITEQKKEQMERHKQLECNTSFSNVSDIGSIVGNTKAGAT